jgi:hypothetical protein
MARRLAVHGTGGRLAVVAAMVALCAGCRREPPIVGVSSRRAIERNASGPSDGGVPEPSPVPDDFRARMTKVGERFLSRGHAEHFDAVIWANDAAMSTRDAGAVMPEGGMALPDGATPLQAPVMPLPDGALLLEELIARRAGGDRPAGLFVMEKRAGQWRFVVVGTRGEVVSDARVAPCAECHREAKDLVFW